MAESRQVNASDRRAVLKGALLAATVAAPAAVALGAPAAAAAPGRPGDPMAPEPVPEQVPATEGFVEVPGGRLWFWDTGGAGDAVILLHPGTGSALAWPYQQPVLAGGGHRVIAYSRRGHYRSSDPTEQDQSAAADLLALADHLGVGRFHVVGAALGGYIALDFAFSHPRRLRSLALVNSQMGIREPAFREDLRRLQVPGIDDLPHSFRELGPSYRAINPAGVHEWEEIAHLSRAPGPRSPFPKLENQITWDVLRTLRTRTLVTLGGADLYMPPALARQALKHMRDASSLTFAEVGHSPQWERPSEFNRRLMRFLRGARYPHGTVC